MENDVERRKREWLLFFFIKWRRMVAFFISHSYRNTNAFNQASGFRKSCSKYIIPNFIMFVKSWLVNGQKISSVEWSLAADFPFKFTLNVYFCHALRYNSTGQYGGFRRPLKGPIVLAINWSSCYCMSACRCIRMNHICYCRFEEMTCILFYSRFIASFWLTCWYHSLECSLGVCLWK